MHSTRRKYTELAFCLFMDFAGMSTFSIPLLGEFFDVIWAPFSALVFFLLFKRKFGLIGGTFNFLEEILPGTDIIPTFTIAWIGKYLIMKEPIDKTEEVKKLE